MARKKKYIIIGIVLAVVVVLGAIGGIALADNATGTTSPANTLVAKMATILGIDQAKVQAAFDQAQTEMRTEALDARLAAMVANGTITQAQADAYKAWMASKPAGIDDLGLGMMGRGFGGGRGGCGAYDLPSTSSTTTTN